MKDTRWSLEGECTQEKRAWLMEQISQMYETNRFFQTKIDSYEVTITANCSAIARMVAYMARCQASIDGEPGE